MSLSPESLQRLGKLSAVSGSVEYRIITIDVLPETLSVPQVVFHGKRICTGLTFTAF